MSRTIALDEWLRGLEEATREVTKAALRFDLRQGSPAREDGERPGAYIAILSEEAWLHVGVSATEEGCGVLARALLGMHPSAPIGDREIVDAVSELMNIVAGKLKSRFAERDPSLRLGLPLFVRGHIHVTDGMETASSEVKVGPVECRLQVYRSARAGGARAA